MKNLVIFFFATLIFSCSSKNKEKTKENSSKPDSTTGNTVILNAVQIKNAGIQIGTAEERSIPVLLKVNGSIDVPPQNFATVSFPPGGYLKSTSLLPGMNVYKGQAIAVMEDPSFVQLQQDFLLAQTKLHFLQKEYERQKLLNETKAVSDKIFEQSLSDYRSETITVSALREKLRMIGINPETLNETNISRTVRILSPISGYVVAVHVNIGKYVSPSDVLFELVNTNDLHLALTVFEKDLNGIHAGQQVLTVPAGDTSKKYMANIVLVGKVVDSNRSAMIHCHFVKPEPRLLPGTFMTAVIQTKVITGIAVPDDAIVQSGAAHYIFIQQKPGQFTMTQIQPKETDAGYTIVELTNQKLLNVLVIKKNAYAALMKLKNTGEDE